MWRPYGDDAFLEAAERDVPVLLLLTAGFCPRSDAAKERLDGALGALSDRYVCVHADKDEEPELDALHRGPGWPSAILMRPDRSVLERLDSSGPDVLEGRLLGDAEAESDPSVSADDVEAIDAIATMLVETADADWGGWGARQKFPHPDALHFLLVRWSATGDSGFLDTVTRTLRSMQGRAIHDGVEGGFFRFASERDWSSPSDEKPLLSNAKRLLAYAEATQVLGSEDLKETALGVAAWMREALLDEATGAFWTSQELDPEAARATSKAERARHPAPKVDKTIHADKNAWAAIALFKAGVVFDDRTLIDSGLRALDFVRRSLFDPGRGVYHYWNGSWNQPGDLCDQGAFLRALVDASHYAGANDLLETAEEVARWTIEHLGSSDGTFRGDLHQPELPAAERSADDLRHNAVMAEALIRLSVQTRNLSWRERGRAALHGLLGTERPHGFATAGFGRALDLLVHEPLHVVVVGPASNGVTAALTRAALGPYVASRVVTTLDPTRDAALLTRLGLKSEEAPYAIVERGGRTYARTGDPMALPALMIGR